jgi:hypothetical protein
VLVFHDISEWDQVTVVAFLHQIGNARPFTVVGWNVETPVLVRDFLHLMGLPQPAGARLFDALAVLGGGRVKCITPDQWKEELGASRFALEMGL